MSHEIGQPGEGRERAGRHEGPAARDDAGRSEHVGRHERAVPDDKLVKETEQVEQVSSAAARAFDLRRIIGGLFVVYGVIVGIYGLLDGADAERKAQGIDINLWSGLLMLLLGIIFLVWERLNPVVDDKRDKG